MVSVAEAERIILAQLIKPFKKKISLHEAVGKILAEPILADRDLPPFNRATMDGIAVLFSEGNTDFPIEGIAAAGQPQQSLVDSKKCFEVMTGAPLPLGTDTVIPYEDIQIENGVAKIIAKEITRGQNIHRQGSDAKKNEVLLSPHQKISPAEISLLASVGKSEIEIFEMPSIALLSTGDELVDINQQPLLHQIRKSNTLALLGALKQLGLAGSLFHVADNEAEIKKLLELVSSEFKIIILSGGVSKGKFDFIPQVLESLGIKKIFHTVSQRPGKPMWFGISEKNFVFALPGNPVSTFMCFYRYVKPWIQKSYGLENGFQTAILAEDFKFKPQLTYFLQVKTKNENGCLMAYPITGGGSGDFANLKDVDGFLELPLEQTEFMKGAVYSYFPFR